ncbi:double-stranded DNA-binding protein [Candidatus Bathyarchaeota archaeon]|nr:MAG: double-stranded DNA-binding protein [Candidatus Bathyarchaeota archaeon]
MSGETEDLELERLKLKKLKELQLRMLKAETEKAKPSPDPFKLVEERLVGRGKEVLEAALQQYPQAARAVVKELAALIASGRLNGTIDGETLHQLFRLLGFPVRLETKIVYVEKGEVKNLADKLRERLSSG